MFNYEGHQKKRPVIGCVVSSPLLNFSALSNPCLRAFPFCQGTRRGIFLESGRAAEHLVPLPFFMERLSHRIWSFHLRSRSKYVLFLPFFHRLESTVNVFAGYSFGTSMKKSINTFSLTQPYCLFFWNFKEEASTVSMARL